MSLHALRAELDELSGPAPDESTIVALPVAGFPAYYLGKTAHNELCVFIQTDRPQTSFDVRLRHLEIRNRSDCRIAIGDVLTTAAGSLVICRSDDRELVDLYVRLLSEAMELLGQHPSSAAIGEWLLRMTTLFSRLEREGSRQLRGLWAELFVIYHLGKSDDTVRRWHIDPKELFDFLAPSFALEVKSCMDLERVHEFSLSQLRPPRELTVWIASVVVRQDATGLSVLDLLKAIEGRLQSDEAKAKLRSMVFTIGGTNLEDDNHFRFDAAFSAASFRLLDIKDIPSIAEELPPEVLGVTLRVRCQDVCSTGDNQMALTKLSTRL